MERYISQEQARTELEELVNGFNSIKQSWEEDSSWKERFLLEYRALRAQLQEGDEVRIEFGRGPKRENSYGFNIVFYSKEGGRKIRSNTTISTTIYGKDFGKPVLYD
ncbi:MAG: hypothetical protein U9Q73_03030 [Nanoarchaeota archaeon]|nr:hypothetical protein [Nanoarchaeota archaeon]